MNVFLIQRRYSVSEKRYMQTVFSTQFTMLAQRFYFYDHSSPQKKVFPIDPNLIYRAGQLAP